jgi:hypothetical protein
MHDIFWPKEEDIIEQLWALSLTKGGDVAGVALFRYIIEKQLINCFRGEDCAQEFR